MVDFNAIKPPSFAPRKAGDNFGVAKTRGQNRRYAMLARAEDCLPHLPGPGESLHAVMTGLFDLMTLLEVVLARAGRPCRHLRITTLAFSKRNVADLCRLLDAGTVRRLTVYCACYCERQNPEEWGLAAEEFARRPDAILKAGRNHCKVACMDFGGDFKLVSEGSANLRTNKNREQIALHHHAGLHDWHAAWIDALAAGND